ncbi:arabinofuranosidase catalytic domain-containing protein [Acidicapsa dinghuensis]|uniref:Arabinofuranosidase catalytic domain-containing protein n=1 Tax=Acidicapsa dinghuensis TaxID=2218256 RepID=A0ABW1E8N8_9BACT|nr:arabinofuranosidase catalytic domain-containing protein [Acidicapsa dinghuensis]
MPFQSQSSLRNSFRCLAVSCLAVFALASIAPCLTSAQTVTSRPCDVLASTTPCVAAISTTRALYSKYTGPLYEVTRKSDQAHTNIGLLRDGYADAKKQDAFCAGTTCTITRIYDQSPNHNDLTPAPPGGAAKGPGPNGYDIPAVADALPVTVDGHKAYGVAIVPGMGYRNDTPKQTAVNGEPEGVYMVTSALNLNGKCCFDFGNAEANNLDNKAGHMDAINIMCHRDPCSPDEGLDMEDGIYGHLKVPASTTFVTDIGASDGQHNYAIYQGNAQHGALTTTGVIPLPKGYQPMKQEGAIILGIGGDNSNWAKGYFFEGVMTKGMPSAATLDKLQANIIAAHYTGKLPQ